MSKQIIVLSLAALLTTAVVASAANEIVRPNISASNVTVNTIDQIRHQALSMQKFQVLNGGTLLPDLKEHFKEPSNQNDSYSTSGNPAYKTGKGVVIYPTTLYDAQTSSQVIISDAILNFFYIYMIKSSTPGSYIQMSVPRKNPGTPSVACLFTQLPKSKKTYMLTLGLNTQNRPIKLIIGDNTFLQNQLTINASNEIRVLFTYDASTNSSDYLCIYAIYNGSQNDSSILWEFKYAQLMQLD